MNPNGDMDRFRNTGQPDRDWWTALWPDPEGTLREVGIDGGILADAACGDGHFTEYQGGCHGVVRRAKPFGMTRRSASRTT